MAKLTKVFVSKVKPPEKNYKVKPPKATYKIYWDDAVKGFGLKITSDGKRVYIVQSRVNGKSIRYTIGTHSLWTPDLARAEAKELLRSMGKGINPNEVQKDEETAKITLRQVTDNYLRDRPLKDSSKFEINRHVDTTFETWKNNAIAGITRADVTERYNEMRDGGLHGKRPAPAQANQSFSVLRALINYARREYRKADGSAVIIDNPCDVLYKKWAPIRPRTRRIPESKIGEVWHMLDTARTSAYNRPTLSAIELVMFLLLTGLRIGEASELTWDRVHLDEGWFFLPDPKNHNPVELPLSSVAVELLSTCQQVKGNPHVFPSWSKSGHIRSPRDVMEKVSTIAGKHLSPHDLRRTYTNLGIAELKIDIFKIEMLTNHIPNTVTAVHYLDTTNLAWLKPEAQQISDWIVSEADIAEAKATGENVIELHG